MSVRDSNEERVKSVFVRGRNGEGAAMFEADHDGPPNHISLMTIAQAEDTKMAVRVQIPVNVAPQLYLRTRNEPSRVYLTRESHEPGNDPWVIYETVPGPKDNDETMHGVYFDPTTEHQFDFVAVTDPEPIVTILSIGVIVCLLKTGLQKLIMNCAQHCKDSCGDRSVKKCEIHSTFGLSWKDGLLIGCGCRCIAECG